MYILHIVLITAVPRTCRRTHARDVTRRTFACVLQPQSLVSDTKAEIARLFGSSPTKTPPVDKKKEPGKKKRVVIRAPPGPPPKTKEEKELDKLEKEGARTSMIELIVALRAAFSGVPCDSGVSSICRVQYLLYSACASYSCIVCMRQCWAVAA